MILSVGPVAVPVARSVRPGTTFITVPFTRTVVRVAVRVMVTDGAVRTRLPKAARLCRACA
ncbi:hypothetical protein [Streptomyces sp. C8S0]|uniref:hypothetical protein n=1 Tax=Streptomyces sp. C8S0 TaxID=2585716 RepID=UPI00299F542B|nr:hypothetical protein [Streptomyces sp. C8S0]